MSTPRNSNDPKRYTARLLLIAVLLAAPAVGTTFAFLWLGRFSLETRWTTVVGLTAFYILVIGFLHRQISRPLQTLANMVAALREEDFSFKARGASRSDALGSLVTEINALGERLRNQHLGSMEAVALLKKILAEIDVAVFTFDPKQRLKLVNRLGEQLMAMPAERMLGRSAEELKLADLLIGRGPQTIRRAFAGKEGRWAIQHTAFRENGVPHELLIISDLSRALREEERLAWQRIIRVLGHELNNSLTPIKSIAGTLGSMSRREPLPPDWNEDVQRGLEVIENRSDALMRFMQAYTKLAKLPTPTLREVQLGEIIRHAASLEARMPVQVIEGPNVIVQADADQLQQLLINIIKNAVEASLDPSLREKGSVDVTWKIDGRVVEIDIRDEGPGLLNSTNLFVPFFTTKAGGSGIGLALSRQIVESHGGTIDLHNRTDRAGCEAAVRLPLPTHYKSRETGTTTPARP